MMTPHLDDLMTKLQFLPGVGPKTAMRMTLAMMKHISKSEALGQSIIDAAKHVRSCTQCRHFSEHEMCHICSDQKRDQQTICVVETPSDLMSVEESMCFNGRYFVLMGHISPIDGIGAEDLAIPSLIHQCQTQPINEVILATNSTVEGEVTAQYIVDQLKPHGITCTRIGHGVPIGGELEYLDGNTVKQALLSRRNWLQNLD